MWWRWRPPHVRSESQTLLRRFESFVAPVKRRRAQKQSVPTDVSQKSSGNAESTPGCYYKHLWAIVMEDNSCVFSSSFLLEWRHICDVGIVGGSYHLMQLCLFICFSLRRFFQFGCETWTVFCLFCLLYSLFEFILMIKNTFFFFLFSFIFCGFFGELSFYWYFQVKAKNKCTRVCMQSRICLPRQYATYLKLEYTVNYSQYFIYWSTHTRLFLTCFLLFFFQQPKP